MTRRSLSPLVLLLGTLAVTSATSASRAETGPIPLVAETPDATVEQQKRRATAAGATEGDQLAALSVLAMLDDRATAEIGEKAIGSIASSATGEVKGEALALARVLASDEGTTAGIEKARAAGVVTELAIVGPFRDTGGGLDAHDGPEAGKSAVAFGDPKGNYSWGSVEVSWRPVPATFAQARGVPLDLFIHPRKESCSFVATKISLD